MPASDVRNGVVNESLLIGGLHFMPYANCLSRQFVYLEEISMQFPEFIQKLPKVQFPPGVVGNSTLLDAPEGQVVFHTITKGQVVPLHQHKDSWAILVSGCLAITLGDERFVAPPGKAWFIPGDVQHGGEALADSLLVEVFCEKRWRTE
jgi:quercetin dioxygenase-like cupin family protein